MSDLSVNVIAKPTRRIAVPVVLDFLQASMILVFGLLFSAQSLSQSLVPLPSHPQDVAWPTNAWPTGQLGKDVDQAAFDEAIAQLFSAKQENGTPDTRAVLIVQGGRIVFEQYAQGFDKDSKFHSWSVAKSFTNAFVGVLAEQGKLDLDQPAPIPAWQEDERQEITLRQMLNMSSGIDNSDGAEDGLIGTALFGTGALNVNEVVANRPLISEPNSQWAYSTATSNLLAFVAGNIMGDDRYSRLAYMKQHLLTPIGASDVVLSFDKEGYFLGGSHVYASARDYARLGYLYLRDGVWDQQRLLPQGWVDFSRTPAPAENNGNHGAHFWLNLEGKGWQPEMLPGGPESTFLMSGNGGQYVYILPTHDMLLVRLGEMHVLSWDELSKAMAAIVATLPAQQVDAQALVIEEVEVAK